MNLSPGARRLFKLIENFIRKSRRAFRASQRWVADHFGVSLRTIKYWYAELRQAEVFAVRRRPNRSSEIVITAALSAPPIAPPVALPTYEPSVKEPSTMVEEQEACPRPSVERKPVQKETALANQDHPMRGFEEFFGLFVAAAKPLHRGDMAEAQAAWTRLTVESKRTAFLMAREQLMRTREARFMPSPARFLQQRSWERTALVRSLPYIDPKQDREAEREANVLRLLEDIA